MPGSFGRRRGAVHYVVGTGSAFGANSSFTFRSSPRFTSAFRSNSSRNKFKFAPRERCARTQVPAH